MKEKERGGDKQSTWRRGTQAWEKESAVILKPAFLHPCLEPHPRTTKAGSAPGGFPALLEVEQPCCHSLGAEQTGKVPGHSPCVCDRGKGTKVVAVSCYVNLVVPRCWLPSCFPGWKMTQVSLEPPCSAQVTQGNHPNPT